MASPKKAQSAGELVIARADRAPANPIRPAIGLVAPAPPGVKAHQLFEEARKASVEHVSALQAALTEVRELSYAIVQSGELYTPGLKDLAARLSEDLFWKSKFLDKFALQHRAEVEQATRGRA